MLEAQPGNLWHVPSQVKVITTNGFVKKNGACVMGRGCAQEARDRWPGLDKKLGYYINIWGNRCFNLGQYDGFTLATMPVKHVWSEPADLRLIATSAWQLMEMADKFHWNDVLLPRPGCGNGQLDWAIVEKHLRNLLDDRFRVITF